MWIKALKNATDKKKRMVQNTNYCSQSHNIKSLIDFGFYRECNNTLAPKVYDCLWNTSNIILFLLPCLLHKDKLKQTKCNIVKQMLIFFLTYLQFHVSTCVPWMQHVHVCLFTLIFSFYNIQHEIVIFLVLACYN